MGHHHSCKLRHDVRQQLISWPHHILYEGRLVLSHRGTIPVALQRHVQAQLALPVPCRQAKTTGRQLDSQMRLWSASPSFCRRLPLSHPAGSHRKLEEGRSPWLAQLKPPKPDNQTGASPTLTQCSPCRKNSSWTRLPHSLLRLQGRAGLLMSALCTSTCAGAMPRAAEAPGGVIARCPSSARARTKQQPSRSQHQHHHMHV